ncbi:MAG: S8 family serine peptidase [Candidatus Zixiibacteriota bacterium]
MRFRTLFPLAVAMISILAVARITHSQDFYFYLDSVYYVNPSDETIAVQFDTTSPELHLLSEFMARNVCLDSSVEVEVIGRGFYRFGIQSGCTYVTTAAALAADPDVHRVTPTYVSPEDGSDFNVTDLVSVQFDENLSVDSCLAIISAYGLTLADSCIYRHNLWWCALADSIVESPLPYGNDLHVLPETEWSSATMFDAPALMSEPSDPYFLNQYYLKNTGQNGGTPGVDIDAATAWDLSQGGGIRIAVLDNGVAPHAELAPPRLMAGWDFVGSSLEFGWKWENGDDDPTPGAEKNHGMACAGIIGAAHNGVGIAGISPGSEFVPIKITDDGTSLPADQRPIVNAIYLAYAMGAQVISNSWGYPTTGYRTDVAHAIRYVTDPCTRPVPGSGRPGVIMVFSSGNGADDAAGGPYVVFPANMPNTVSVGAVDKNGTRWDYSNYGSALDLVAPSGQEGNQAGIPDGDVWTTDQEATLGWNPLITGVLPDETSDIDFTAKFGGTSAACPQVAGIAALLLSRRPDLQYGCAPYMTMREIVRNSATDAGNPGWDQYYGAGIANAYRALLSVIHGDVDKNGFVDATDLSILIDVCFFGQPMPYEYSLGDMDCNGFVDATDLAFEVDLVFFGWGPPEPCFLYY